jgi:3-phenylpropionate/trans-cinnamate dioxygenase ferredoxin subunit
MPSGTFHRVAPLSGLAAGSSLPVEVNGESILLCNSNGHIHAIENRCSHAGEKLDCGRIRHGWISCPVHGARFNLETGDPISPPATEPVRTFPVRIADGWIEVQL